MKTCCLCSNLSSGTLRQSWDNPLYESRNFVALPSLGSLVEGWLLLVPKEHFISMGAIPLKLAVEMEETKAQISAHLAEIYGQVCTFEHGPAFANRKVGCSVDHAHLHIVPLGFSLSEASTPFLPLDSEWKRASWQDCRDSHSAGKDYLYLEQPLGKGLICSRPDLGSQVFRKAIASQIGRPDEFNWRDHPEFDTVARTISVFAAAAHSLEGIARE